MLYIRNIQISYTFTVIEYKQFQSRTKNDICPNNLYIQNVLQFAAE